MPDALEDLESQIKALKQENEMLRKALAELEAEKATLAHTFLGTSLNIRALLQQPRPET